MFLQSLVQVLAIPSYRPHLLAYNRNHSLNNKMASLNKFFHGKLVDINPFKKTAWWLYLLGLCLEDKDSNYVVVGFYRTKVVFETTLTNMKKYTMM